MTKEEYSSYFPFVLRSKKQYQSHINTQWVVLDYLQKYLEWFSTQHLISKAEDANFEALKSCVNSLQSDLTRYELRVLFSSFSKLYPNFENLMDLLKNIGFKDIQFNSLKEYYLIFNGVVPRNMDLVKPVGERFNTFSHADYEVYGRTNLEKVGVEDLERGGTVVG